MRMKVQGVLRFMVSPEEEEAQARDPSRALVKPEQC
jgi:hypothetical protein